MSVTAPSASMRWDMSVVYPSLTDPAFDQAFSALVSDIRSLRDLFDSHGVRRRDDDAVDDGFVRAFEEVVEATNALERGARPIRAYVHAHVSTDARDEAAQARLSELERHSVELAKLSKRFDAWVGTTDVDALLAASAVARDHEFALRRRVVAAAHQMSEAEEDLAASLSPSNETAWGRLYRDVCATTTVELDHPAQGPQRLPMSAVRGLAADPDPAVREAAYRAELEAWKRNSVPLAAALNSIKGTVNVLNDRRGWPDALESALFNNAVDRGTLEAMQAAVVESFPDFRRYLAAKAKLLGRERLPWWDLFAPLGAEGRRWDYDDSASFIVDRFATYSDALASLARRSFDERWIDAEPRDGKSDGGYCMALRDDESRVFINFVGSFNSVSTLAHELGHAYHNVQLANRTSLQRQTPMALAETASIFCQTIVTNAMLADATGAERLAILEAELQGTCQIIVDIHSRFLLERDVFDRRRDRALSVSELNDSMLSAQHATYGDAMDPDALHPFMWAAKPHYYGSSFYNWPYTFGMLFGLGLYAQYRRDPDGFRAGYDDLLSSTGLADAAALGRRFGIDFSDVAFWRSSIDPLRERIDMFVREAQAPAKS